MANDTQAPADKPKNAPAPKGTQAPADKTPAKKEIHPNTGKPLVVERATDPLWEVSIAGQFKKDFHAASEEHAKALFCQFFGVTGTAANNPIVAVEKTDEPADKSDE